jgi:hypothetical protein
MKFRKITTEHAQRIRKDVQLWYMDPVDKHPVCQDFTPEDWVNAGDTNAVDMYFRALAEREWYIEIDDTKPEYTPEQRGCDHDEE